MIWTGYSQKPKIGWQLNEDLFHEENIEYIRNQTHLFLKKENRIEDTNIQVIYDAWSVSLSSCSSILGLKRMESSGP